MMMPERLDPMTKSKTSIQQRVERMEELIREAEQEHMNARLFVSGWLEVGMQLSAARANVRHILDDLKRR